MKKLCAIIGCLLVFFAIGNAQIKNTGTYRIVNYSIGNNDKLAPTHTIQQDRNGIIFFGNNKGLTIFDGNNWQVIKMPNNSGINSLFIDTSGIIYVGALDEFGYLKSNSAGELFYCSLLNKLKNNEKGPGNVKAIYKVQNGILFVADNEIILNNKGKCSVLKDVKTYGSSFQINNKVYINENYTCYKIYDKTGLVEFPGGNQVGNNNIQALFEWRLNKLLAIDNERGCLEYEKNRFAITHTNFSEFAVRNKITSVLSLRNGYIVLGSLHDGILIIDPAGNIVQHISKVNGLENNHILSLFEDNDGNLWTGHDMGVSCIEISSPATYFGPKDEGGGFTAVVYNHRLYFGTSQGLFVNSWPGNSNPLSVHTRLESIEGISGQIWNLSIIDKKLYVSYNNGTFIVNGNSVQKIPCYPGGWGFLELPDRKDYILQGTYAGFSLFKRYKGELIFIRQIPGFNRSSRIFETDNSGFIWITHGYEGVYRIRLAKDLDSVLDSRFYGKDKGFPSNLGINVCKINNKLLFTSEHGGIYEYNLQKDSFILDTEFDRFFGKVPAISKLYQDKEGNIWFFELNRSGVLMKNDQGSYEIVLEPFSDLTKTLIRGFELIYPIDNRNIIFGTINGFVHYDPSIKRLNNYLFRATIRKIQIIGEKDSLIYGGYDYLYNQNDDSLKRNLSNIFPHKFNSFRFGYIVPSFENIEKISYSYYLEGFDPGWSGWTSKNEREYTNLPGGNYIFHIKAKNINGVESREDTFSFYVKPPFTETWIAYIIYFIGFCLLVTCLVFFYSRKKLIKYRRENLLKEKEIINLKNHQLNSEIEYKNKELGSLTMQMIKRNEILLKIKNKLEEMQDNLNPETRNEVDYIFRIIGQDINTEKDWEFIQVNFDNVYIGFLKKLKELFPELRSSELQLCAYIRMGLNNKEIATLMSSTVRGVEGYRYRLRKNLGLIHDDNIKDFLFNLI
jgi:ligand-binding sensor domain-containing protein